ncbi:MAG TPA: hypothetical protein VGA53_03105 [Candidatus Paceibacterota bacterium]
MSKLEYTGTYSVIHTDTGVEKLFSGVVSFPNSVSVEKNRISVQNGRVQEVPVGGFQLYSEGDFFASIGYRYVKEIHDGIGNVLWQNRHCA